MVFKPKCSTIDAISDLTYLVYKAFEENEIGIGIFLDLSKAFDTINHSIVIKKIRLVWYKGESLGLVQKVPLKLTTICSVSRCKL